VAQLSSGSDGESPASHSGCRNAASPAGSGAMASTGPSRPSGVRMTLIGVHRAVRAARLVQGRQSVGDAQRRPHCVDRGLGADLCQPLFERFARDLLADDDVLAVELGRLEHVGEVRVPEVFGFGERARASGAHGHTTTGTWRSVSTAA